MRKLTQLISYISLSIIILITLAISPAGLQIATMWINYNDHVHIQNISGSLWSGHIKISEISSKAYGFTIRCQDFEIDGLNLWEKSVHALKLSSLEVQKVDFREFDQQSSIWETNQASANMTQLITSTLLKPLSFKHIEYLRRDNEHHINFTYNNKQHSLFSKLTPQEANRVIIAQIDPQLGGLTLFGHLTPTHLQLQSTQDSFIQGVSLDYNRLNHDFDFKVNHQSTNLILNMSSHFQDHVLKVNIPNIQITFDHLHASLKGLYSSYDHQINMQAKLNDSSFVMKQTKDQSIIMKGSISDLASFTDLAKGKIDLKAHYKANEQLSMKVSAEKLDLPMLTLHGCQLTYNSANNTSPLWLSAKHIHTPVLDLGNTSLHLEQSQNTNKLFIYSSTENTIQQILLTDTWTTDGHMIEIPSTYLQLGPDTKWLIEQSQPIQIHQGKIEIPRICAISNHHNSTCISGYYQLNDQSWKINHQATNLPVTFNTHGMIELDSEVALHQATLHGKSEIQGHGNHVEETTSSYELKNLAATISNILPEFPFPVDYEIQGGQLSWQNDRHHSHLHGILQSPQGDIHVETDNNHIRIHGNNLNIQSSHNHIHANLDLQYHDSLLTGNIHFLSLDIQPSDNEVFQSLPGDIKIIGEAPYFSANHSITTDIKLHSDNTPVNLYGFKGNLCGTLSYFLPPKGSEKITGYLTLQDPSLIILNRQVKLDKLNLHYQHHELLDGHLNINLSQPITFSTSSEHASTGEINLNVSGKLQDPVFETHTRPFQLNLLETLTHLFYHSKSLPPGNENYIMLEFISDLSRNESIINLIHAVNSIASSLELDIGLRTGFKANKGLTEHLIGSELIISKPLVGISDKLSAQYQHPFNEHLDDTWSINYRLKPWLSFEGASTKKQLQFNAFINN